MFLFISLKKDKKDQILEFTNKLFIELGFHCVLIQLKASWLNNVFMKVPADELL
jgi:hypothetical protein